MKIVAIADTHIGADRWHTPPEQWDAPFAEAVEFAIEEKADVFVVAGDLFDRRNPSTEEYERAMKLYRHLRAAGILFLVSPGNHDISAKATSIPASWPWVDRMYGVGDPGRVRLIDFKRQFPTSKLPDLQVVTLPWPRPVDYGIEATGTIDEQIEATRKEIWKDLLAITAEIDHTRPSILIGHAMISYGHSSQVALMTERGIQDSNFSLPPDPNLLLGKDVVIPYDWFEAMKLDAILLGHVHDSGARGYLGSTQPTNFGEADQEKFFTEIDLSSEIRQPVFHRHQSSRSLTLFEYTGETVWSEVPSTYLKFDVARARLEVDIDSNLDHTEVKRRLLTVAHRIDSIEIKRPRKIVSRVSDDQQLTAMNATDAFDVYMEQRGVEEPLDAAARAAFEKLIVQ